MSKYEALLFDLDGTLVNTEPLHREAWQGVLAPYNIILSSDWFRRYTGFTDRVFLTDLINEFKLDVAVNDLLIEKRNLLLEIVQNQTQTFEGVQEGLWVLKDFYKLAVVTTSSKKTALKVLEASKLLPLFKTLISFDDVENPKPNPEPYVKAAQSFGLEPGACIAIEDSTSGLRSARDAGCFSMAVLNSVDKSQLGFADKIFRSTKAAMDYIKNLS